MESKKNYVIGIFTGMIVMVAGYLAISMFYPRLFGGESNQAVAFQGRFNQTSAATPSPAYATVGSKVDAMLESLSRYYVDDIDMNALSEKIYHEIASLIGDPYTSYMDAKQFKDFLEDTEGIYAGIGVTVSPDTERDRIVVVVPFEGYPGNKAGILPGDAIIKVNGYDVGAYNMSEAISMMKGEPGTSVNVTLYRESSDETYEVTIVRELIEVPTVSHEMLESDIGYLRITQFERVTYNQFVSAFDNLKSQNMKGLILDLRNNPGGILQTVTMITDLLVPEGTIVYTEDKMGRQQITHSDSEHLEIPLLVLVNSFSTSASEVLSGAVRDHSIGELVGTTTFGKGLVQNLYPLADESAIKITVSKYYTPSGVCIQDIGLVPDYEMDMDLELTVRLASLTIEEDVQKKYAVDIMKGKLGIE